MDPLWKQPLFWVAMIFAVAVKWRASPTISLGAAAISTVAAVSGALVFTAPLAAWLALGDDHWRFAIAGLVALTCEHVGRIVLGTSLEDVVEMWRGGRRK